MYTYGRFTPCKDSLNSEHKTASIEPPVRNLEIKLQNDEWKSQEKNVEINYLRQILSKAFDISNTRAKVPPRRWDESQKITSRSSFVESIPINR